MGLVCYYVNSPCPCQMRLCGLRPMLNSQQPGAGPSHISTAFDAGYRVCTFAMLMEVTEALAAAGLELAHAAQYAWAYSVFRPVGYDLLVPLEFGRGPDPMYFDLHLTHVRQESDSCKGLNDVLAVTLTAPVVGDISPTDFHVTVCPVIEYEEDYDGDGRRWPEGTTYTASCDHVVPACARLQVEDDPRERRTVLLFGQFAELRHMKPIYAPETFYFRSLSFLIDGNQTERYGPYYVSPFYFGMCAQLNCALQLATATLRR